MLCKTLVLNVYDHDKLSRDDAIGQVRLPVCKLDLISRKDRWEDLQIFVDDIIVSNVLFYGACILFQK